MNILDIKNDIFSDRVKAVILDSDTYNEEDDQFAIAYAMLSPDRIRLLALNAAPFHNSNSESLEDGMLKSYDEIIKITNLVNPNHNIPIFKGSRTALPDASTPVPSEAADNIIKTARSLDEPLYIIAIGAITNVASALLMAPDIRDKVCVIWLALHAPDWPGRQGEFNFIQDRKAAQALFASGAHVVLMPACGGSIALRVSPYELDAAIGGKNELCDTLINFVKMRCPEYLERPSFTKIIWDLAGPAVLTLPEQMHFNLITAPDFADDEPIFTDSKTRHLILIAKDLWRDPIFQDMYDKFSAL